MKRIILISIALSILFSVKTFGLTKYTITSVNVRESASTDGKINRVLPKGSTVEVVDDEGKWSKVSIDGKEYFMSNRYLSTDKNGTYLGRYTLTFYCNCKKCCGKWAGGPTYSGTMPEAGRTIAVDKNVIPLGTRVQIVWSSGVSHVYTAEDIGSGVNGKHIDIYVDTHSEASARGCEKAEVYLY